MPVQAKKKIIMVMGVQRSGTTVLFKSLASDSSLTAFHESIDDAIYYLYRLRPLAEIAPILEATPGAVLLKPLSEITYRSLEDLRKEYAGYELQFVWIYRDPVNVLHSMSRKGWVPDGHECEAARNWVTRNNLALQFQQAHPATVAVVRYEDLIADRNVFRALCGSLGTEGRPSFREDRGQGRGEVPLSTQRAISALTDSTLRALDAARSFRPGRLTQWKSIARSSLPRRRPSAAPALQPPVEWAERVRASPPMLPSQFDSLFFWLDASRVDARDGRIFEVTESGPGRLRGVIDSQPPFCIPFIHGKRALFFPTIKASERLKGDFGLLRFAAPGSAADHLLECGLSGFALIKPHIPKSRHDQERLIALRLRSTDESAQFILDWDAKRRVSRAIFRDHERSCSVETLNGSHPHQQWRLVYFQVPAEHNAPLLICADGIANTASPSRATDLVSSGHPPKWKIEIGGSEDLPAALFYGAIAEVALFRGALKTDEQFALTKYLKEKYRR